MQSQTRNKMTRQAFISPDLYLPPVSFVLSILYPLLFHGHMWSNWLQNTQSEVGFFSSTRTEAKPSFSQSSFRIVSFFLHLCSRVNLAQVCAHGPLAISSHLLAPDKGFERIGIELHPKPSTLSFEDIWSCPGFSWCGSVVYFVVYLCRVCVFVARGGHVLT